MTRQALIAGGGIGGLAAALSAARAGWDVRLYERAAVFSEVGAGVQLGPNVTRLLQGWGLKDALAHSAAFPSRLQVRDAVSGRELGVLPLGKRALQNTALLTPPFTAPICMRCCCRRCKRRTTCG